MLQCKMKQGMYWNSHSMNLNRHIVIPMYIYIFFWHTYTYTVSSLGLPWRDISLCLSMLCSPKNASTDAAPPRPNEAMKTKSGTPYYAGRTQQGWIESGRGGNFGIQLGQLTSGMFRGKTGVTMGKADHRIISHCLCIIAIVNWPEMQQDQKFINKMFPVILDISNLREHFIYKHLFPWLYFHFNPPKHRPHPVLQETTSSF